MNHDLIAKSPDRTKKRNWPTNVLGIVMLCVVLLIAAGVMHKALRPMRLSYSGSREVRQLRHDCTKAVKDKIGLKKEIRVLEGRSGAVAATRVFGYVRPGETPVSIEERKEHKRSHRMYPHL